MRGIPVWVPLSERDPRLGPSTFLYLYLRITSDMLARGEATGVRDSAPQEAASRLLSETSPVGLGVTPNVPSESEEGMLAHCNSSALCVPPEDPGEQASRRHNSVAEGYSARDVDQDLFKS